jgi:hypothetical protein
MISLGLAEPPVVRRRRTAMFLTVVICGYCGSLCDGDGGDDAIVIVE